MGIIQLYYKGYKWREKKIFQIEQVFVKNLNNWKHEDKKIRDSYATKQEQISKGNKNSANLLSKICTLPSDTII